VTLAVLRRSLLDRRRSLLWWSVGVGAYVALMAAVFPSIRDAGLAEMVDRYPPEMMALFGISDLDFASGAGFLSAELFGFVVPLFVLILVIGTAAAVTAGAEDAGTLDLVLTHPVPRRSYLLQQAALVAVEALWLGAVVVVVLVVANPVFDLGVDAANLVGAVSGTVALGVLMGWLGLALGAATGSRAMALGGASALAALAYLAATLPELVEGLRPVRYLSPFWYATSGSPLTAGYTWWHLLVLLGAAAAVLAAGVARFERRNLAG
jgi:ABC-2 type transport system permease protein